MPLMYEELRRLAARWFDRSPSELTLQPTAIVHEAWIKLARADGARWNDREHFFATAALAMRQVLLTHAKARGARKRGGGKRPVPLEEEKVSGSADGSMSMDALLDVAEEVDVLRSLDSRKADVVELRFFGGLSMDEIARMLDVSRRTCEDDWRSARAWLATRLRATD